MTTGLHSGGPPQDPRPTENQLLPRQGRVGHGTLPADDRTRSSVITARAAASFDPVGRSVATARSFVRDTLQGWGFADIVDDAVVLTSELVTNAVVHAGDVRGRPVPAQRRRRTDRSGGPLPGT